MCIINEADILKSYQGEIETSLKAIFAGNDGKTETNAPTIQHSTFLSPDDASIEHFLRFHSNNFTVLSLNIDSLHSKKDYLKLYISKLLTKNLFFSAICIQEARISKQQVKGKKLDALDMPEYNTIPMGYVASTKGGLVTYLHESFFHTERSELYRDSALYEAQYIDVFGPSIKNKLTIINLYRPPRNDDTVSLFLEEIRPSFTKLKLEDSYSIVCADFNINLLNVNTKAATTNFFEFMCDNDFLAQITLPTHFNKKIMHTY